MEVKINGIAYTLDKDTKEKIDTILSQDYLSDEDKEFIEMISGIGGYINEFIYLHNLLLNNEYPNKLQIYQLL